jgi:eukaryotic-like serine/threonine-protein kinase
LCKHCLHKNPKTRLELVKWTNFTFKEEALTEVGNVLAKIKSRQQYARNPASQGAASPAEIARLAKLRLDNFCNRMESRLSILINSLQCFPPRATTSDRDAANSTFTVHLQFQKSHELGLDAHLLVHLKTHVLDPAGDEPVYRMSIAAELLPVETDGGGVEFTEVRTGTADELLSGAELEAYLVKALEAAYGELDKNSKTGLLAPCTLQLG